MILFNSNALANTFQINGTSVITLKDTQNQSDQLLDLEDAELPNAKLCPFPAQFADLVPPFGSASCLQITKEGFWIAWNRPGVPVNVLRK